MPFGGSLLARIPPVRRWRPAFLFDPAPGVYAFAVRTALSALAALYAAYALQLESPYWAATTALIVANPVYGQIVSKSVFRFFGTLAGGAMALVLAAFFSQTPELFILALSLWIGLCMTAGTLLRNFTAYGAILAGYTTAIITLGVVPEHPLLTFDTVMARVAAITIGILAAAVVSGLLKPGGASRTLELRMRAVLGDVAALLERMRDDDPIAEIRPRRRQLARDVLALDTLVGFAAAESGRIRDEREGLLGIAAALLHAITGIGGVGFAFFRTAEADRRGERLRAAFDEAAAASWEMRHFLEGGPPPDYGAARERLAQIAFRSREAGDAAAVPVIVHRLRETLEHLELAARGWAEWRAGRPVSGVPGLRDRFDFDRDPAAAVRNGVRCAFVVWAAGAFWIATAWPAGATLVMIASIFCCIASVQPNPLAFGVVFMEGVLITIPAAGLLTFGVLPRLDGFVPLAAVVGLAVGIGALAMGARDRRIAGIGVSFLTLIMTLLALRNPMAYDFGAFLNLSLATLAGALLAIACSVFFLPIDLPGRARRLIRSVCGEVAALARSTPRALPHRTVWESRMYDRLSESMPHLPTQAEEMEVLDSAFAALQIGASLIDLRAVAEEPGFEPRWREALGRALDGLATMGARAGAAAAAIHDAAALLLGAVPGLEASPAGERQRLLLVRSAASLEGISLLLADRGAVFERVCAENAAARAEGRA